ASRRRQTRFSRDWSSDVCSSDLDQWVDGRSGSILVRIANRIASNGSFMCFTTFATVIAILDIFFGVIPCATAGRHGNGDKQTGRSEERRVGTERRARALANEYNG